MPTESEEKSAGFVLICIPLSIHALVAGAVVIVSLDPTRLILTEPVVTGDGGGGVGVGVGVGLVPAEGSLAPFGIFSNISSLVHPCGPLS